MNVARPNLYGKNASSSIRLAARGLAYFVAALTFVNALYFVLRATSPVMRDDDWYFLDVFLSKAIDGTLGFADFFVKRLGPDHAQPLFKLVMLAEWRYFGLDLTPGAIIAVFAAAACALVYLRLLVPKHVNRVDPTRYLAWAAICALLFSLNGSTAGQWTWPLNALVNVTNLIILLFLMATWHAHRTRRYTLLVVATLFLGFSSDDTALITAIAALLALLLMQHVDHEQRNQPFWKIPLAIVACMVVVRIAYRFFPVVGGAASSQTLSHELGLLIERFGDQGWWMWAVYPLTVPVSDGSPFRFLGPTAWLVCVIVIGLVLVVAHLWFWRKAFRCRYNRTIFVAVATMLVTYGYIAGIVLFRVGYFGNVDMEAPRYIVMYTAHLIALLLMWIATREHASQPSGIRPRAVIQSAPAAGCMILVLLQIPLSVNAWRARSALHTYYATMATEIGTLAANPERIISCVPELPVCKWPEDKRAELTRLLSRNELNVFSPRMQEMHPYLPRLNPVSPVSSNAADGKSKL